MTCIVYDGEKVLGWPVIRACPLPPVAMYMYTKTHAQINQKNRFGIKPVKSSCVPRRVES